MPTYVYECSKCGEELEVWQSFSDDSLTKHPDGCGGKLTKVFQPVGIVLKGPGFYKTDSRNGKKSSSSSERSDSSSDSGSSPDSGSAKESTPEKKTDSSGSGSSESGSKKTDSNSSGTKKADTAKPAGSTPKSS